MNTILFAQLATLIANLSLGFLVLLSSAKSLYSKSFAIFLFGVAGWNLSLFMVLSELGQPLLWGRLAFSLGSFMPAGLFLFSLTFPWEDKLFKIKKRTTYVLAIIFFILPSTNLMIKSVFQVDNKFIAGELLPSYFVYLLYFFGLIIYSFVNLIKKRIKARGRYKPQLTVAASGIMLFFIPLFLTQLILPIFGVFQYNSLGPVFSITMVLFIAYAIMKYQFMDIRIIIQRSFIYTIIAGFVIFLYLSAIQVLGYFFQHQGESVLILSGITSTVIGVLGAPIIEKTFRKKTNKFFFKNGYIYGEAMQKLVDVLSRNVDIEEMIEEISLELEDIFKIKNASIVLVSEERNINESQKNICNLYKKLVSFLHKKDKDILVLGEIPDIFEYKNITREHKEELSQIKSYMEESKIEIVAPIVYDGVILAFLFMGEKLSGDIFTKRDFSFIKVFSSQTSVALKKAELYDQVKDYSKKLEKRVEERTEKIRNLQKDQEKIIMEISHELQTPLSVMKLELNLMKDRFSEKELAKLERSIDGASKLVYDFMHLVHLEAEEHNKVKNEELDLSNLMNDLVEYFEVLASEKGIRIDSDIQDKITIMANPRKIEEAITNILSNAIKYIPEEGKRESSIIVSLSKEEENAKISIKDTGEGIEKEDLPYIFDRFYRRKSPSRSRVGGIGLGLAITKKIIESHDGAITVESETGKGTTFLITLPLVISKTPSNTK